MGSTITSHVAASFGTNSVGKESTVVQRADRNGARISQHDPLGIEPTFCRLARGAYQNASLFSPRSGLPDPDLDMSRSGVPNGLGYF
jgi:hypothetical protein